MTLFVIQTVNYTLSFLMWMIVGRALLRLISGDRENAVMLAFVKVTDPVYAVTRRILPFVRPAWVPALSFFLLVTARVAVIVLLLPSLRR